MKSSDMRHKVKVMEQVNIRLTDGSIRTVYKDAFTLWCSMQTTFREQLEYAAAGGDVLKNRIVFETRYTDKLTSAHRVLYKGALYKISIVGDTDGTSDRIRFIGEALENGGA